MDRSYMAAQRVAVYKTQADKDAGRTAQVLSLVPYPSKGFDNFKVNDVMYPAFVDPCGADACVVLTQPLFPRADRPVFVR
jgi:hypothetical protein